MESWQKTKQKNLLSNRIKRYIPLTVLIFSFLLLCVIMGKYASIQYLTSDASSELVLGKILSDEGGVLTKSWFYSTEIRVLNTQLIWALLFKFTDNWRTVRVAGTIILYGIMLASYLYMCSKLKIEKKLAYLSATLLFIPISDMYSSIILLIPYYAPYVTIAFLCIGMTVYFVDINEQKNKKVIYIIMMTVLALLAGLGGLRILLNCYIPLFCAAIMLFIQDALLEKKVDPDINLGDCKLDDEKKWVIVASVVLIFAGIGNIINSKILSTIYRFKDYGYISFTPFSYEKLQTTINAWLGAFGYDTGKVFSMSLFENLVCFIIVVIACTQLYYVIKKPFLYSKGQRLVFWFVFFAFLAQSVVAIITDADFADRYVLLISIFAYPTVAVFYQSITLKNPIKRRIGILIFTLVLFTGGVRLVKFKDEDYTMAKREAVEFLVENGYSNGLATFWQGNILTELSSGKIEMYTWESSIGGVYDIDQRYEWLQKVEHLSTQPEKDPFLFLTQEEYGNWWLAKRIDRSRLVYESPSYIIFAYPDYSTLQKDFVSQYEAGTGIVFYGESYNANEYVETGISTPEQIFSWTDGDYLELEFVLDSEAEKLRGSIEIDGVFNWTQDVTVLVNNEEVYHDIVSEGGNIEFDFNTSVDGYYDIEMLLPQAISPKELGMSNDDRNLALTMKAIKISEIE